MLTALRRRWRALRRFMRLSADDALAAQMFAWAENRHRGRLRANYATRNDLRRLAVGPDVRLEVFWKDLPIGRGPALSVFMLEEEILRFDCFGPGDGHMHAALFLPTKGETRLHLAETTVEAQIDRCLFEIERNLGYYQARVPDPNIRQLQVDRNLLCGAIAEARRLMRQFAGETAR